MTSRVIAEWVDDGFLHPPATLASEFVDVDEFLRIPVDGLSEIVQFARVRVGDIWVIVFGPDGWQFRAVLENFLRRRHPEARQVFISSADAGLVVVRGEELAEVDAFAVAVTQFGGAWDESAQIEVRDDRQVFLVTVAYQNDKYLVSTWTGPG